jgi:hypothetical protein
MNGTENISEIIPRYADSHKDELKDDKKFAEKMEWLQKVAFELSYNAFNRPLAVVKLLREEIRLEDKIPEWKKRIQSDRDSEREVALDEQESFDPSVES